jgi:dTDP-4-dehydrorhamnose reductase
MVEAFEEMKKILITGAGGFLGTKLVKILSSYYKVVATDLNKGGLLDCDITNKEQLRMVIKQEKPDVILHAAALPDVDFCETNKDLAYKVNVNGTKNVADVCVENKIKLIFISTDYVFDGKKGNYKEDDERGAVNYYGHTKELAEDYILSIVKNFILLRVSVLYGYNGNSTERSFVNWTYNKLKENKMIVAIKDHVGTPTLVDDIANAVKRVVDLDVNGIFHVAGRERISKYDLALKVASAFGFNEHLVESVFSKDFKQTAERPKDSSLDTTKIKQLDIKMSDVRGGIEIMKKQMEEK